MAFVICPANREQSQNVLNVPAVFPQNRTAVQCLSLIIFKRKTLSVYQSWNVFLWNALDERSSRVFFIVFFYF